jgi:hypothetical protein
MEALHGSFPTMTHKYAPSYRLLIEHASKRKVTFEYYDFGGRSDIHPELKEEQRQMLYEVDESGTGLSSIHTPETF